MEYLQLYDKAKSALAEAHSVDELSAIIDQADIIKYAAKVAKDNEMLQMATEIKLRAERRFGEVSRELEKATKWDSIKLNSVKVDKKTKKQVLADVGISEQMNHQFEKLASIPEQEFETALINFKDEGNISRKRLLDTLKVKPEKGNEVIDITPERDRPISYGVQAMTLLNIYRKLTDINTVGEMLLFFETEVNRLERLAGWNLTKF